MSSAFRSSICRREAIKKNSRQSTTLLPPALMAPGIAQRDRAVSLCSQLLSALRAVSFKQPQTSSKTGPISFQASSSYPKVSKHTGKWTGKWSQRQ